MTSSAFPLNHHFIFVKVGQSVLLNFFIYNITIRHTWQTKWHLVIVNTVDRS